MLRRGGIVLRAGRLSLIAITVLAFAFAGYYLTLMLRPKTSSHRMPSSQPIQPS